MSTRRPRRILVAATACGSLMLSAQATRIVVTDRVQRTQVKHFGVNLSGQNFYDSGQMLRNLVHRNPGFEGEIWQSILHCKKFAKNICTDENQYTVWPTDFLAGARYEILSGKASGATGTIQIQDKASPPNGATLRLSPFTGTVSDGDFLLVKKDMPGSAEAGWWPTLSGGAGLATETRDLSPATPGRQALRIAALHPGQHASLISYFDTFDTHSFVQMKGSYRLTFRAKSLAGAHTLHLSLQRQDTAHGMDSFLDKTIDLAPGWHDYRFDFPARDKPGALGHIALKFDIEGATLLLDDVSLTPAPTTGNNTAFRDEVVAALRELQPGILRFMDNGGSFGSSLDNLLAPQFARQRAGYSTQTTINEDIPIGLTDFLGLCEAVKAEPWISLPPGFSPEEMAHLMEYLGGPASTPYGKRRTASGHEQPWTEAFTTIHLELGNEQWNAPSFAGGTIADPKAYGIRAARVFHAARASAFYKSQQFDLIAGSWFSVPWWTGEELNALSSSADTIAVAPYLFSEYNAAPNPGIVFGGMFAQPEQFDSRPDGSMSKQSKEASTNAHSAKLAVYEVNLGTATGDPSITQKAIDLTVPSLGGGLAVADHMLLMLRDLGITNQCVFSLPEYQNHFASVSGPSRTTPLWGIVVDMGGATNRRRPVYLAEQLINQSILSTMLTTQQDGANPTWDQPSSPNDHIVLQGAHEIQSFAFASGSQRSLIVFNLNRDHARNITFDGPNAPTGTVHQTLLTSSRITDSNEDAEHVKPVATTQHAFQPHAEHALPPFSMTVYSWQRGK